MTSFDTSTGMQRVLTFDDTLTQMQREKQDSTKPMNPALVRAATNFWISPFNQRMYDNIYEDMKRDQVIQANKLKIQAAEKEFQADTGIPPDMMPPSTPPRPPGGGSRSSGDNGHEPGGEPPPAPSFFSPPPGSRNFGDLPRRTNPPPDVDGIAAMSVDGRGPPPPPAPPMAIPIPVVHTPQQVNREDELRLVAEMRRVSQQRDMAQRELQTAQNVANMLHREREKDPIRVVQRAFYREPAVAPQVQPTPTVTPEQVQAAMQQAMAGERRNLRQLLVHHNQSMADLVNKAAATVPTVASPEESATPPKKSRNYPRPLTAPTTIGSQKRKRDTEDIDPELGPRIPANPSAAIYDANQVTKRMARKRKRDTEDIDPELGPRIPANPSGAIYDANQVAKRMARKRPGGSIDAELAQRVPENPAVRMDKAANLGRKLAAELTRRMVEKKARESARETKQTIEDSKRRNPSIRMDQFDNKRPRGSIADDIDDAIAEYTRRRPQPVPSTMSQHLKRRPIIA